MEHLQLLVIGNPVGSFFRGWLGHVDDDTRNVTSYVRTCKMISEIGGAPGTKDVVLEPIRKLNEKSQEHLGTFPRSAFVKKELVDPLTSTDVTTIIYQLAGFLHITDEPPEDTWPSQKKARKMLLA